MGGMILCWLYPTCDSTASHVFFGALSHWGSFSSSSHAKLDHMLDASNKDDCLPIQQSNMTVLGTALNHANRSVVVGM